MPFLNMKSNSITGCLREKSGLCVCSKSATISKNSCSRVKVLKEADIDLYIQNSENVSFCNKINTQKGGNDEDIDRHDILDDENVQFLKHLWPLTDPATLRMESSQDTSTSTLFSPISESIEIRGEANINSDTGLQFDGDMVYDDITGTTCLPDFQCDESNTSFDVTDDYMILPLLEDTFETNCDRDIESLDTTTSYEDDSSLYFAIHQLRKCDQDFNDYSNKFAEPDQSECFDPQLFIRNQSDFSDVGLTVSQQELPKKKSVTLVLDLDETLVHSTLESCDDADFSFPVLFNMKEHMVYVKQRPNVHKFLERVAEMFDVVVFTASLSIYAKQLLDKLDPDGKVISRRAYRESCICLDGNYIKDLTIFGVDLSKIAIIDNSPQVFQLQVNNGIPIKSWFDDPSDNALISLIPFLEILADADDVRPLIAKRCGNLE